VGVVFFALLGIGGYVLFGPVGADTTKVDDPSTDGKGKTQPEVATVRDAGTETVVAQPETVADAGVQVAEVDKDARPAKDKKLIEPTGALLKVIKRDGDYYILLDKKTKLGAGDSLLLVGEAEEGSKKRELLGSAGVMEVKGAVASLLVDEGGTLPDKVFAVQDVAAQRVAKHLPNREVKDQKEKDAKDPKDTKDAKLGDPKEPTEKDKVAGKEPEDKKPPQGQPEKKPPPEQPKDPPAQPPGPSEQPTTLSDGRLVLKGTLTVATAGGAKVLLRNANRVPLTNCEFRIAPNIYGRITDAIAAGEDGSVLWSNLRTFGGAPDPQLAKGWGLVQCREGAGYMWVKR
jgi:hypothetical protein